LTPVVAAANTDMPNRSATVKNKIVYFVYIPRQMQPVALAQQTGCVTGSVRQDKAAPDLSNPYF